MEDFSKLSFRERSLTTTILPISMPSTITEVEFVACKAQHWRSIMQEVSRIEQLAVLIVDGCRISDYDVEPLVRLRHLTHLNLGARLFIQRTIG